MDVKKEAVQRKKKCKEEMTSLMEYYTYKSKSYVPQTKIDTSKKHIATKYFWKVNIK